MNRKPIASEFEYQAILQEIDKFCDSNAAMLDESQINELLILVQIYEDEHYSIPKPTPFDAILYFFESRHFGRFRQ